MPKLIYLVKDVGCVSPVVNFVGTQGGQYGFVWDAKRSAHVREYDLSKPEDIKKLRGDQYPIFNQKLTWPIFTDVVVTEDEAVKDAKIAELEGDVEFLKREVDALRAELEAARAKRRKPSPVGDTELANA